MSIYATLWHVRLENPASNSEPPEMVSVWAQSVPSHIGSRHGGYQTDPYGHFLPPPVEYGELRAVVFITEDTNKVGQRYTDPLLVLSGREYRGIPFPELLDKLTEAIGRAETSDLDVSSADGTVVPLRPPQPVLVTPVEMPSSPRPGPRVDALPRAGYSAWVDGESVLVRFCGYGWVRSMPSKYLVEILDRAGTLDSYLAKIESETPRPDVERYALCAARGDVASASELELRITELCQYIAGLEAIRAPTGDAPVGEKN